MAEEQILNAQPDFSDDILRNYAQPSPIVIGDELRRWQLDPIELLERVERFLRRERYDERLKRYTPIYGVPPMANEYGIQTILAQLGSMLDPRSIALSNFEEDDVLRSAKQSRIALSTLLLLRYKDFGIQMDHVPIIVSDVDTMVYGGNKNEFKTIESHGKTVPGLLFHGFFSSDKYGLK